MEQANILLKKIFPALAGIVVFAVTLQAQDKKDKETVIKNIVETKQYVFSAESAQPSSGRLRQLTYGYQVEVNGDTIKVDLPYFGRAYSAPIDASNGGIHFATNEFDYTNTAKKKGGWRILIKPKGNVDTRQLDLDISTNGRTYLQVISNNRQPIFFTGYIAERKAK